VSRRHSSPNRRENRRQPQPELSSIPTPFQCHFDCACQPRKHTARLRMRSGDSCPQSEIKSTPDHLAVWTVANTDGLGLRPMAHLQGQSLLSSSSPSRRKQPCIRFAPKLEWNRRHHDRIQRACLLIHYRLFCAQCR